MSEDWVKRLEEIQAAKAQRLAEKGEDSNVIEFRNTKAPDEGIPAELADAVPTDDFTDDESTLPEEILSADQELERFVRGLSTEEVYKKYIGKEIGARKPDGEIMISCPFPHHEDKDPSASFDPKTGMWHCHGRCLKGGDTLDLLAVAKGVFPEYKNGSNKQGFHNLFRSVGEDYGWKVEKRDGIPVPLSPTRQAREKEEAVKKARADEQKIEAQLSQLNEGEQPPNNVISIEDNEDDYIEHGPELPTFDWRPLVKEGTFLDYYMQEVTKDTAPEEFHFWNGLVALSLAAGNNVQLGGLKSNLFLCLFGKSALGKGTSMKPLKKLLKLSMKFDEAHPSPEGVFIIDSIQTGEGLVKHFVGEIAKPGQRPVQVGNIKGLVAWEEMATILINSNRGNGNILKTKLNEFYDCNDEIVTRSASSRNIAVNPFASLVTALQPENFEQGLSKEDITSGYLNRFVFVTGTRKPGNPFGMYEHDLTTAKNALDQVRLTYLNHSSETFDYVPTKLSFAEEARDAWRDLFNKADNLVANGPGSISRINTLILKLAMLFTINNRETQISLDSVNRVEAMWDYIVESYMAVDSTVSRSENRKITDDILNVAREAQKRTKGAKYITIKFLANRRSKYDIRQIRMAVADLVAAGLMKEYDGKAVSEGRRGKPIEGPCYLPAEVS